MRKWRRVVEFSGYMVSSDGLIKSFKKYTNGYIMSQSDDKDGYKKVTLTSGGKEYTRRVHRIIAEAFLPNPENKTTVNHKNGIKFDNRLENLEWATVSENTQHAFDNNLIGKGGNHHNAKKYEVYKDDVLVACFDNTFKLSSSLKISREHLHYNLNKNKLVHDVFQVVEVDAFEKEVNLNMEIITKEMSCDEKYEYPISVYNKHYDFLSTYPSVVKFEKITGNSRRGVSSRLKDGKLYKNKYYIKRINRYDFLTTPTHKRNLVI